MKKNHIPGVIWQVIVAIFLLLPLTVSFIYSFAGRWTSILPQNLTFRFYLDKFKDSTFFLLTLFAVIVYFPKMEKYIQVCCIIPTTINGIILATSILSTYAGSGTIFSNRIIMLMFTYCIFCLPLTYQGIRNSLYAVNTKTLLEAASILGANKFYGFLKIIVPTVLPGLMNTALISFSALFGDFAIIKIIASSQYETVQTYLYKNRNTDLQSFSAGVVILLVLTMIINLTVHKCAARNTPQGNKENRIK